MHEIHSSNRIAPAPMSGFLDTIPPLPVIVTYVLELTESDDLSILSLAHALEADPALTAKLLRVSNSAFYAPPQRVHTVRDAIQFIGFDAVRSLAVSTTIVSGLWVDDEMFNRQAFWRHSLRCGLFARKIGEHVAAQSPDILFTLGVLHDIGRAALIQYSPTEYHAALESMRRNGKPLWKAEQEMFGVDHADIGGMLAEKRPPANSATRLRSSASPTPWRTARVPKIARATSRRH
jgi:HD-like signal output (HDOD) protein